MNKDVFSDESQELADLLRGTDEAPTAAAKAEPTEKKRCWLIRAGAAVASFVKTPIGGTLVAVLLVIVFLWAVIALPRRLAHRSAAVQEDTTSATVADTAVAPAVTEAPAPKADQPRQPRNINMLGCGNRVTKVVRGNVLEVTAPNDCIVFEY